MNDPRIYLAIDNCFAAKRWAKPSEWVQVIQGAGLAYVEASTDNECDPLYTDADFMKRWIDDLQTSAYKRQMHIANFYSGHGSYTTMGLTHYDRQIRDRFENQWIKPLIDTAAAFGAGVGFFCHGFNEEIMQNQSEYAGTQADLYSRLARIAQYAAEREIPKISVEQMYTPHQIPWTIRGSLALVEAVYAQAQAPLYITVDTGHQSAQRSYERPNSEALLRACQGNADIWLGPNENYSIAKSAKAGAGCAVDAVRRMGALLDTYGYMFAEAEDSDTYRWLAQIGCYSPIIHLQQTNGMASAHLPFTKVNNAAGCIDAKRVLQAIARSYEGAPMPGMPPRCADIYLTLELFFPTRSVNHAILGQIAESVEYWREFVPRDGLRLSELL